MRTATKKEIKAESMGRKDEDYGTVDPLGGVMLIIVGTPMVAVVTGLSVKPFWKAMALMMPYGACAQYRLNTTRK